MSALPSVRWRNALNASLGPLTQWKLGVVAAVPRRPLLEIRVGYELIYHCPRPTPMMLMLNIHYTRASDIVVPDHVTTIPSIPLSAYRDAFGNWCTRLVAPTGRLRIASAALVKDSGEPD